MDNIWNNIDKTKKYVQFYLSLFILICCVHVSTLHYNAKGDLVTCTL